MTFRKTDTYKKKVMRIGAAMRRYGNDFSAADHNFNSLSLEVDALEELSLAAFSLMKAIKKALVEDAETQAKSLINIRQLPTKGCACSEALCDGHKCVCHCHKDAVRDGHGNIVYPNKHISRIVSPFSKAE